MKKPKSDKILGIEKQLKDDKLQLKQINKLTENSRQATIQKHAQKMSVKLPKYNNLTSKERNAKQIEYLQRRLNQRISKQINQLSGTKKSTLKINGVEFDKKDFSEDMSKKLSQIRKLSYSRVGEYLTGGEVGEIKNKQQLYKLAKEQGYTRNQVDMILKGQFDIKDNHDAYKNVNVGEVSPLWDVNQSTDKDYIETLVDKALKNLYKSYHGDILDVNAHISKGILEDYETGDDLFSINKKGINRLAENLGLHKIHDRMELGEISRYLDLIEENLNQMNGFQKRALLNDNFYLETLDNAKRYAEQGNSEGFLSQMKNLHNMTSAVLKWKISF